MVDNIYYLPTPPEGKQKCDFCSALDRNLHTFKSQSFSLPAAEYENKIMDFTSVGDWGACPICKALIDADKYDELLERSMVTQVEPEWPAEFIAVVRAWVSSAHQTFKQKRIL